MILRLVAGILGGGALVGAYLLKPSSIVPLIALVLVSLLATLKKRTLGFWVKSCLCFLLMVGTFGGGLAQMRNTINHQHYIMVDKNRENPPLHFIQIGMTGDGGYSPKDDLMMGRLYSKQEKNAYSLRKIKRTLHQRGLGYLSFLVAKHGRNTADATFSWGLEGHFFKNKADNQRVKTGIASFVYPQGDNLDNFRFVAQIAWIILLTLIAFGWREQRLVVQALRLGMIGGFLFLLIFEGGRSRYLIQFLPVLFIIAALCRSCDHYLAGFTTRKGEKTMLNGWLILGIIVWLYGLSVLKRGDLSGVYFWWGSIGLFIISAFIFRPYFVWLISYLLTNTLGVFAKITH